MRTLCSALVAALVLALPSQPAAAKVGDKAWAQCVWQTDAEAAGKWIKLNAPAWQDTYGATAELLGYRLIAMCDATPADTKRPNRLPNWKGMQQQLARSQPKAALAPTASGVEARICEHYSVGAGERALYLAEVLRVQDGSSTTIHQAYFNQAGSEAVKVVDYAGRPVTFQLGGTPTPGATIRMPQDTLIASPAEGYTSKVECRTITAEGERGTEAAR